MYTQTSTNSDFTITMEGDFNAYLSPTGVEEYVRTRCSMIVQAATAGVHKFIVDISGFTPMVFYTDSNGMLEISLRDVLQYMMSQGFTGAGMMVYYYDSIYSNTADDSLSLNGVVYMREGIGYRNLHAPRFKDVNNAATYGTDIIMPPNVIISPTISVSFGILIETNIEETDSDFQWNVTETDGQIELLPNVRSMSLGYQGPTIKTYHMQDAADCVDLLCVQWRSLTGVLRRHYFPIVSFIRGNGEELELETVYDGYKFDKDNFTAVRCRMTGLTQWGYYYYMDLLQSSEVNAMVLNDHLVQFVQMMASPMSRAYIEGQSSETPTGVGFFNFEFVCNLKQFGA